MVSTPKRAAKVAKIDFLLVRKSPTPISVRNTPISLALNGPSHSMDLTFDDMQGHFFGLNRRRGQFLNFLGAPSVADPDPEPDP
jgi:hypothetical protein